MSCVAAKETGIIDTYELAPTVDMSERDPSLSSVAADASGIVPFTRNARYTRVVFGYSDTPPATRRSVYGESQCGINSVPVAVSVSSESPVYVPLKYMTVAFVSAFWANSA
jgi:hypothetical protein